MQPHWTETLPDPLPDNPLRVAAQWLAQAREDASQPNPNSMVLATVDAGGRPSARVVLCKEIEPEGGFITFYTNYQSRKGGELEANPQAAIVFHWDHRHRQVRAEGRVERLTEAENDAYFQSRPWQSRLGAWASRQSEPVESRARLGEAVAAAARQFGIPYDGPGSPEPVSMRVEIPRPPNWGGFRLAVNAVELWVEGEYRIHDRARWTRHPAASGRTASGDTASGRTASGGTASGDTASGRTASGGTASGDTASGRTASGGTASGDTASGSAASTAGTAQWTVTRLQP